MTEDEQRRIAKWLEKARKKIKEVTYKAYCKGHDHCVQARRIEAERKKLAEGDKDKGKAPGSCNTHSERVTRKSVAQLIIEQKEVADIRVEMSLKQKEVEATYLMGNT